MSLSCTKPDWSPRNLWDSNSLFAESPHVAVGAFYTGCLAKKQTCAEATAVVGSLAMESTCVEATAAAGQHIMHHGQPPVWSGKMYSGRRTTEIPAPGNEIDIGQGFISAAILNDLHEPSPIQSAGQASTAIIGFPTCEGIPIENPESRPHVHPPEPLFIPIPNLFRCEEKASSLFRCEERAMISRIQQTWEEAQGSAGCDNFCASALQQLAGASVREDNERLNIRPYKNGVTLMLSNLPTCTKVDDVVEILNESGCYNNLMSFYMPTRTLKRHSKARGYIFLRFDCCEAALRCFDAFNGRYFGKRKECVVKLAYEQCPGSS